MTLQIDSEFFKSGAVFSAAPQDGKRRVTLLWGTPERRGHGPWVGDQAQSWVFAPDFFLGGEASWWRFPRQLTVELSDLLQVMAGAPRTEEHPKKWSAPDWGSFEAQFHDLQERFKGGLKKAVPIVFSAAHTRVDLEVWIRTLFENVGEYPLSVYGLWNSAGGILGATPEVLFDLNSDFGVKTMALAGTRKQAVGTSQETPNEKKIKTLLDDPKEMAEHGLVIDGLIQSLGRVSERLGATASVRPNLGQTTELHLAHLVHLHTPLEWKAPQGEFQNIFEMLIQELHPTPALGAYPKQEGLQWLRNQPEAALRGRFGAPFALVQGGSARCVVAIRNIQWEKEIIRIAAGCGVIPASILEKEKLELQAKVDSVKKLFGMS